jgi:hypothetical protein
MPRPILNPNRTTFCKCGQPARPTQRRCYECHARYMREWRKTHLLTGDALAKDRARHCAAIAVRRGQIPKSSTCQKCASGDRVQMHHPDYSKPNEIQWLCFKCHLEVDGRILRRTYGPNPEPPEKPLKARRIRTSPRKRRAPGCSCGSSVRSAGQRNCKECHASYMRAYRASKKSSAGAAPIPEQLGSVR